MGTRDFDDMMPTQRRHSEGWQVNLPFLALRLTRTDLAAETEAVKRVLVGGREH